MIKESVFHENPPTQIVSLREKIVSIVRATEKMIVNLCDLYECCSESNRSHIEQMFLKEDLKYVFEKINVCIENKVYLMRYGFSVLFISGHTVL